MDLGRYYPTNCKKSIRRLVSAVGMSEETAYSMILMTAALMDLKPEDPEVVDLVLEDCGIFPDKIA